jgi:UDP-N-acetylmuramoyl-tripeptide--D-alanyl-D-alanine ligase
MRLQVHQHGSMIVVNDSYNANPASMRCAIEALEAMNVPGRRVAIIGDMRELGEQAEALHRELGRLIASSEVDVLMSVGDFAEDICESARASGNGKLKLHASRNVEDLEKNLRRRLKAKDTILIKGSRALQLERILARLPRETPKRGSKPRPRQPRTSRG